MMSKKHFQKFADALARVDDDKLRKQMTDLIADVLSSDNYNFDRSRFDEWIRRVRNNEDLKGLR